MNLVERGDQEGVALRMEGEDRNDYDINYLVLAIQSPSVWRARIETPTTTPLTASCRCRPPYGGRG